MKFDVAMLKQRTDETIQAVFADRSREHNSAVEKLEKYSAAGEQEAQLWKAWAQRIAEIASDGKTPTDSDLGTGRPKTLEEKAGHAYTLRDRRNKAGRTPDVTTVPGKLQRFKNLLEMSESTEISTNELKTHGFVNFESLFNPANYR